MLTWTLFRNKLWCNVNILIVSWHNTHRRYSIISGINSFTLFTLSILVPKYGKWIMMAALTKDEKLQRTGVYMCVCVSVCVCVHISVCMYPCACICSSVCVCVWVGVGVKLRKEAPILSIALVIKTSFEQKLRLQN